MNVDPIGYVEIYRQRVDGYLTEYLAGLDAPPRLVEGMRYALLGPGKRIRPIIALACARCVGSTADSVLPAACALELVHAYSLVHDDLPALDDDELRRGRPTAHVAFGEAQAILIGDALLSEAFALLGDLSRHPGIYAHELLDALGHLARAAGACGMVGGQLLDVLSRAAAPSRTELEAIHLGKTARLIQAAAYLGARLGGGVADEVVTLSEYGLKLGLAFQTVDDVLAEVAPVERTGKRGGRDRELGRLTAVSALGLDDARRRAVELIDQAVACLQRFDERARLLEDLARQVLARID